MPEPGIGDSNFDHPTSDRKKPRRRSGKRLKLPGEYAEFRLTDGRYLGEVMGESFFGPETGVQGGRPITDSERQRIRDGNYPLAGMFRDDPQFRPRSEAEAGRTSRLEKISAAWPDTPPAIVTATVARAAMLDEREAAGAAVNNPIAGRLPAGIGDGAPGQGADAPVGDPRAISGMDDAGLTGLADSMLDIEEIAALEPETYDDYMRYAMAIAEGAGMREEELRGLESLLISDENGMLRDVSRFDILPAKAREYYARFVEKALARRNTPLDLPRATGGAIDMTLVQPGFVYKTGDGVLFMVDPDRKKFGEARKLDRPNADGALYEPIAAPTPISLMNAIGKPPHAGEILAEAQQLIKQTGKGFRETRGMRDAALEMRDAARVTRLLYSHYESLHKKAPGAPKTRVARDLYLNSLRKYRGKAANFHRAVTPEFVSARDMMYRAKGRGPSVTHKIPMTEDGRVNVRDLDKRVTYEVEDGTRFVWDGGNFREVYEDRDSGAWMLRTDPADRRPPPGMPGTRMSPREIMDAAEDIQGEAKRFRTETEQIRSLALALIGVRERLRNRRLNGLPESSPETTALNKRLADGMPILRGMLSDLTEAAEPEAVDVEEMADRVGWPSRVGHAARKIIQGGVNVGGDAMKGWATNKGSSLFEKLRNMEKLERDGDFKNIDKNQFKFELDRLEYQQFLQASPEEQARMKQTIVESINAITTGWRYSTGEGLQEFGEEGLEFNSNFEKEFFASKLPEGLGKAFAYTTVAAAGAYAARLGKGRGSKVGRTATTTLLASQELAGQMFDDALENGATLEQAFRARDLGQMLGLIEAIPIMPLLNRLTPELRSRVLRTFSDLIKSGVEAGIKEAAQKFGLNLVVEGVVQYNSERGVFEGIVDGYKVSFTSDVLKNSLLKAIGLGTGN